MTWAWLDMMPAVLRLPINEKVQSEISNSKLKKLLFYVTLSAKESELKWLVATNKLALLYLLKIL